MIIPLWRRAAIALVSLTLGRFLFAGQVADALVTRGDDAARGADPSAAVRYYRRALAFDAHSGSAADRLAFALDLRRTPGDARAAVDVASAALLGRPHDPALLADRAWAEETLRRWSSAEHDFARAATAGRDPRYAHLAARIALAHGRRRDAAALFHQALGYDRHFEPARAALAQL